MSEQYYYITNGNRQGPVPISELKALAIRQTLKRSDKIWNEGMASWQSAETLTDIFQGLPPDIESVQPKNEEPIQPHDQNKKNGVHSAGGLAALSFFLPGVGQMVCGQSAKGTIFLIVSIVLNLLTGGLVSLIICPFAAIDAYRLATIKNSGASISDWDFMPSAKIRINFPAFWAMMALSVLFTIVSLLEQQRAAEDQRFGSLMDTIRSVAGQ